MSIRKVKNLSPKFINKNRQLFIQNILSMNMIAI